MLITPKKALEFLRKPNKRPTKKHKVDQYASDMLAGKWRETAEPISIDTNGVLQNGVHRCLAIVKTNKSFNFYVATECPPENFDVIDTGASRSNSDVLALAGYKDVTSLAAMALKAVNLLNTWDGGKYSGRRLPNRWKSPHNIKEWVEENPRIVDLVVPARKIYFEANKISGVSMIGGFWFVMNRIDREKAAEFWDRFLNMNGGKGCPVAALRRVMVRSSSQPVKIHTRYVDKMIIRAWNAFIKGKKLSQMTPKMAEAVDTWEGWPKAKRGEAKRVSGQLAIIG